MSTSATVSGKFYILHFPDCLSKKEGKKCENSKKNDESRKKPVLFDNAAYIKTSHLNHD